MARSTSVIRRLRTFCWPIREADTEAICPPGNDSRVSAELGVHRRRLVADQAQRDVDVVDQQVPGDAGLDPRRVRTVPDGADVHRVAGELRGRHDGAVVALEQAAHERQVGLGRGVHDLLALRQVVGHRLLHEHRQPGLDHLQRQAVVCLRGGRDDDRVHAGDAGEVGRPGRTEAVGHGTTDLLTRLDDDGQIGAGGVVQHPGVQ
jgi:hypothetical protein